MTFNKARLTFSLAFVLLCSGCIRNSIIGRKQLTLFPESSLQQMALTQYHTFLSTNRTLSPDRNKDAAMVNRIGNAIAQSITSYFTSKGKGAELADYKWEFKLVQSDEINAWCLPGGKVVVFTGLLKVTQNENALAIVMGHEITHAVAKHGNERMSQAFIAQGIQVAGDVLSQNNPQTNKIFNQIYAPTASVGVLLPNSRSQESEADRYGMIFAAMAGFDPREAVPLWERMSASGQSNVPEFLATHPSNSRRIEQCRQYAEEAMGYYKKSK
jgi:predicted Zn-dependent protease